MKIGKIFCCAKKKESLMKKDGASRKVGWKKLKFEGKFECILVSLRGLADDYIVLSQQYCLSFAFCCCFGTFVLFAKRNGHWKSLDEMEKKTENLRRKCQWLLGSVARRSFDIEHWRQTEPQFDLRATKSLRATQRVLARMRKISVEFEISLKKCRITNVPLPHSASTSRQEEKLERISHSKSDIFHIAKYCSFEWMWEEREWERERSTKLIKIYITRQGTTEYKIEKVRLREEKEEKDECDELFSLIFHILHDERRIEIFISSGDSRQQKSSLSLFLILLTWQPLTYMFAVQARWKNH